MAPRVVLFFGILILLSGGCAGVSGPHSSAVVSAMPLTEVNVDRLRVSVNQAKAQAQRPATKDEYVRFARQVYVKACPADWSPAATTEVALAQARAGQASAREYLTIMVYDLQLQAAMEGVGLDAGDWHDIYVGSGIMSEPVFARYAAMTRSDMVLP